MKTRTGVIIMSIVWGIGLASLFRKACEGSNCVIIKGPNPNEVTKKVYSNNGECYKFETYVVDCEK